MSKSASRRRLTCSRLSKDRGGRGTKRAPATKCAGCAEGRPRAAECSGSRCTKTAESCKWARVQISGLQRGSANTLTKQAKQCNQFLPARKLIKPPVPVVGAPKAAGFAGCPNAAPPPKPPPPVEPNALAAGADA